MRVKKGMIYLVLALFIMDIVFAPTAVERDTGKKGLIIQTKPSDVTPAAQAKTADGRVRDYTPAVLAKKEGSVAKSYTPAALAAKNRRAKLLEQTVKPKVSKRQVEQRVVRKRTSEQLRAEKDKLLAQERREREQERKEKAQKNKTLEEQREIAKQKKMQRLSTQARRAQKPHSRIESTQVNRKL